MREWLAAELYQRRQPIRCDYPFRWDTIALWFLRRAPNRWEHLLSLAALRQVNRQYQGAIDQHPYWIWRQMYGRGPIELDFCPENKVAGNLFQPYEYLVHGSHLEVWINVEANNGSVYRTAKDPPLLQFIDHRIEQPIMTLQPIKDGSEMHVTIYDGSFMTRSFSGFTTFHHELKDDRWTRFTCCLLLYFY